MECSAELIVHNFGCIVGHNLELVRRTLLGCGFTLRGCAESGLAGCAQFNIWRVVHRVVLVHNLTLGKLCTELGTCAQFNIGRSAGGGAGLRHCPPPTYLGSLLHSTLAHRATPCYTVLHRPTLCYTATTPSYTRCPSLPNPHPPWVSTLPGHSFYN